MSSDERRNECKGEIEHRGRTLSVTCSGCDGPQALEERRCFMGLSSRLTPGFTGEVMLRSVSDRRYHGPMVEALSASAEVLDMISALGPASGGRISSGIMTGRIARLRSDLRERFVRDPSSILDLDVSEKGVLSSLPSSQADAVSRDLERVMERTRRMIARMEGAK